MEAAEDRDGGLFVYWFVGVAAAGGENAGRAASFTGALGDEAVGYPAEPVEFGVELL